MSKQKILMIILLIVGAAAGGFFVWKKLELGRRKIVISNQADSIVNIEQATDNNQNTTDNIQQSINNIQSASSADKSSMNSNQQPATSNQKLVTSHQESATSEQKKTVDETEKVATGKIVQRLVSWGFQKATDRKIDTVILHSSYDALGDDPFDVAGIIAEYKQYQVSAHYLIARDGTIYQLVADQNIAWHAGAAKMPDSRTNVNSFSLGIEMINTQDGKFTAEQYGAVNWLIGDLKKAYPIKNILGHSDIAPDRKTDPWGIEWKRIDH